MNKVLLFKSRRHLCKGSIKAGVNMNLSEMLGTFKERLKREKKVMEHH